MSATGRDAVASEPILSTLHRTIVDRTPLLRTRRQTVAWSLRARAPMLLGLVIGIVLAVGVTLRHDETRSLGHRSSTPPAVIQHHHAGHTAAGDHRAGRWPRPTRPHARATHDGGPKPRAHRPTTKRLAGT